MEKQKEIAEGLEKANKTEKNSTPPSSNGKNPNDEGGA